MSQRDFSEHELESTQELATANKALFLEKVRLSNSACQNGDFHTAVSLYTEALELDPGNYILFSNRSAARLKQGQFSLALEDAIKAKDLNPNWPKAFFRQGVALQCLGRYGEALACFATGLAQDENNSQLLGGLIEAAIKSPLRLSFEPVLYQLRNMDLDRSPFVAISVVGQELLQVGQYESAVAVLEAALRIGSTSLKLRGSVFSALSSAHWALNNLKEAISFMQQDLGVSKSLGDTAGECRAHGNLGSAYFSQGSYKEALTAHRYQLVLAMKCKDTQAAAAALTSLGHVYTAIGDYPNALASHKQCVQLVKQIGDRLQEAREIGNVGTVYLAMGEFDSAQSCHNYHLTLAKKLGNKVEEARAYSNLGSLHHYKRNFTQAMTFHEEVLKITKLLGDKNIEVSYRARAYAGLGHAARCGGDLYKAKMWHEKQLEMALAARDKVGEGRACSNLGIVYQLLGEHDAALKLHQAHLTITQQLEDQAGIGRAYGNIGNAYSSAGLYEQAIKYHKQELIISKEVNDRAAEASTHGNLAVAWQALGIYEYAYIHYKAHLNLSRELKDTVGEAVSLMNLANCLSTKQEFERAIPYYEQYLMLSQEMGDVSAEGKACHFLGYAHYCLGNYKEAVRYYDQDLTLAKDLQDKMNMGRAYCNLGLAHLALGNIEASLESQKYFLAVGHMTNHLPTKARALGNIGDIFVQNGELEEAINMYQKQLEISRQSRENKSMEASACGALGLAHRMLKKFDKALGYHTQELTLRQEMCDLPGECRAHQHLGTVLMALGNYTHAVKYFKEQLERSQELQDLSKVSQAFGNLGIAKINMGHYEEAIGHLEQQLGTLEQISSPNIQQDKAKALGYLGDCYDALGDYEEAIKCHQIHLNLSIHLHSLKDQQKAYRGLAVSYRSLGNLKESLVNLEKRLVVIHESGSLEAKAVAYGDLADIHKALQNYDQALSCLEHQKEIAVQMDDKITLSDVSSALGNLKMRMGDIEKALEIYKVDLDRCENFGTVALQARACSNLGEVYEHLQKYDEAIKYFEKQLSLSTDRFSKSIAYLSIGRVNIHNGENMQSIKNLQHGLALIQSLNRTDDEAKIRYQLGIALRATGDLESSRLQIEAAVQILESARLEQKPTEEKINIHSLQTGCYIILQQILVQLGKTEEALLIAERRKARSINADNPSLSRKSLIISMENILDIVNNYKANVIYFSIAGNDLYSWFIQPIKGIVRFNALKINDSLLKFIPEQYKTYESNSSLSLLQKYIYLVRDRLGISTEPVVQESDSYSLRSSSENLLEDYATDKANFLRMVNRNHLVNSSNYSLSSLFSLGSVGGSSLQGSTRSFHGTTKALPQWQGPSCLHTLYSLLVEAFDDLIPTGRTVSRVGKKELIIILENELYLVPFAILRSGLEDGEYLSERCSILAGSSLQSLKYKLDIKTRSISNKTDINALVLSSPESQEAAMVAELLQSKIFNGTKKSVMNEFTKVECIHFVGNISAKLGSTIMSTIPITELKKNQQEINDMTNLTDESNIELRRDNMEISDLSICDTDVQSVKLNTKLVVISSYNSTDNISGIEIANLVNSWLNAGAGAVLISLWPVPETASKILLRAFYSGLLQGVCAARALADAMQTVKLSKHFAAPVNWAGFLLIGGNIRLSNKEALIGKALCELMKTPDNTRDAFRVCLHLVEKSLQRIHRGQRNAMYTTQKSIENKAGTVVGWKDLLMAVGFRFEPAANGIQSSVFFPQSDPEDRLSQLSASLQALMGLTPSALHSLSKLVINSTSRASDIIKVIRDLLNHYPTKNSLDDEISIEVPINVELWRIPGCHELFASLGFDLAEVGQDKVVLKNGKQGNRRNMHFILQALLSLFDTQEPSKSIDLGPRINDSSESFSASNESEVADIMQSPSGSLNTNFKCLNSLTLPVKFISKSSAFTYVKRRGEPDGGGNDNDILSAKPVNNGNKNLIMDNFSNKTDSEQSDEYNSYKLHKTTKAARLGYLTTGLPNKIKITRPGGGGESDAAFTPSPPVLEPSVSLALAHQTKIRNLYSSSMGYTRDKVLNDFRVAPNYNLRPESSSSAGSDWESSGHATILRRASNQCQNLPLFENLKPLCPIYHNMNSSAVVIAKQSRHFGHLLESTSSDSDGNVCNADIGTLDIKERLKQKTDYEKDIQISSLSKKADEPEKSNLRTKSSNIINNDNRTHSSRTNTIDPDLHVFPNANNPMPCRITGLKNEFDIHPAKNTIKSKQINIHESILRHVHRDLTPSISDVYQERKNQSLGLAPPLSKLLFAKNVDEKNVLEIDIKNLTCKIARTKCLGCNEGIEHICKHISDITQTKKSTQKPWISNIPFNTVKASDLTTADILELQNNKMKSNSLESAKIRNSFSELSRRDDGDGRSVADSQCSSTLYKTDYKTPQNNK